MNQKNFVLFLMAVFLALVFLPGESGGGYIYAKDFFDRKASLSLLLIGYFGVVLLNAAFFLAIRFNLARANDFDKNFLLDVLFTKITGGGNRVLGQVEDERGQPLAFAKVELIDKKGKKISRAYSGKKGKFTLKSADGTLRVEKFGFSPFALSPRTMAGIKTREVRVTLAKTAEASANPALAAKARLNLTAWQILTFCGLFCFYFIGRFYGTAMAGLLAASIISSFLLSLASRTGSLKILDEKNHPIKRQKFSLSAANGKKEIAGFKSNAHGEATIIASSGFYRLRTAGHLPRTFQVPTDREPVDLKIRF